MTEFITKEEVRTILARTNPVGVDAETYMVKVINLAIAQKFEVVGYEVKFDDRVKQVYRRKEDADYFQHLGGHAVTTLYALKGDSK